MRPLAGANRPARLRMVVVLPAPLLPSTISPGSTAKEMPLTTSSAPYAMWRSLTSSKGIGGSQIGGDHPLVTLHRSGWSVGDHGAVVEHSHPVRDADDKVDMVLDQQHGHSGRPQLANDLRQQRDLFCHEAGRRLVEQQHLRPYRQRAGDFEQSP